MDKNTFACLFPDITESFTTVTPPVYYTGVGVGRIEHDIVVRYL